MQTKTTMITNSDVAYGQEQLHLYVPFCRLHKNQVQCSIFGKKSVNVQQKILKKKIDSGASWDCSLKN